MPLNFKCTWCGKEIAFPSKAQKDGFMRRGRIYCSKACGDSFRRLISSQTMRETNLRLASDRMKSRNPMSNPSSREKMKKSLSGRTPTSRMGNGMGLTKPQAILLSKLSKYRPAAEYPVSTNGIEGLPTCYKVDIAIPEIKLAIEVDGRSHRAIQRKIEDKKKDDFLCSIGWMVERIKNEEILNCADAFVSRLEDEIACLQGLTSKSVSTK